MSARFPARFPSLLFSVVLLGGCQTTAPRYSEFMEAAHVTGMPRKELELRVNDFVSRFASLTEGTADSIIRSTDDLAIRRAALEWKIHVIPAAHNAAFRADPALGLLDVWVLTLQLVQWWEGEAGRRLGPWQPVAVEASRELAATADGILSQAITDRTPMDRERVAAWVTEHPIDERYGRVSTLPLIAGFAGSGQVGAFAAVGTMAQTVDELAGRLNIYAEHLPKQARWQAEYFLDQFVTDTELDSAFADLGRIERSSDAITQVMTGLPETISAERAIVLEALRDERRSVMAELEAMRSATVEDLRAERVALGELVAAERAIVLLDIERQRLEAMRDIEAMRLSTIEELEDEFKRVIDHFYWRFVQLLFGLTLVVALAVYGWSRRRRTGTSKLSA